MPVETKTRDTNEKPPTSAFVTNGRAGVDSINGNKQMGVFAGGQVYLDPVLMRKDITMVHVNFQPCARTHWHKHEGGQLLKVTAGSGWVCDQGEKPRKISVGDIIWCPPNGIHWHGADDGSFMSHEAISFGGLEWYDPVTDEVYAAKK
ncbi:Cupin domain-containing protein [Cladophialophora immunda]|nr:Cupin domain-containing protein [Cladophialophora immunda]